MKHPVVAMCVLFLAAPLSAHQGALRGIARIGQRCWAVGDAGTVLVSQDDGQTWRPVSLPAEANFQSVAADQDRAVIFGGRGIPGHPEGFGRSVIYRSDDAGESFRRVPAPPIGWLYGGRFADEAGVVFGQASHKAPSGISRTVTDGRLWKSVPTSSAGFLRGGAFSSIRRAYLVGQNRRIVPLRDLNEAAALPPEALGPLPLTAAALAEEKTCWAVGASATVLRSGDEGQSWMPIRVDLPPGTRRLADFETIAFASPSEAWIGGGLLGTVLHTSDAGATWQRQAAPVPGPIHALKYLGSSTLLAAGEAGRIWRSTDGGNSWRGVHGQGETDVLFVMAAGDISLYPAIVAHAAAGCNVPILFASRLPNRHGVPVDQPLRAAAIAAGARGVTVLGDFGSPVPAEGDETLSEKDILAAWSKTLDVPAKDELLRQIVAAIRLYRPAVLAVGPTSQTGRGLYAENHLIARLAREAAQLAASPDTLHELQEIGLKSWQVRRIFVGLDQNENWTAPWQKAAHIGASKFSTLIDATAFPRGRQTSLEMIAQRAIWQIPGFGLLDRPAGKTAYRCMDEQGILPLFTAGITNAKLRRELPDGDRRDLSAARVLRIAEATGQTTTALEKLIASARQVQDDPLPLEI